MKTNFLSVQDRATSLAVVRSGPFAIALSLLLFGAPLASAADNRPAQPAPSLLNPGDIIRSDSGDQTEGACLLKVNPQTGQESILAMGGFLGFLAACRT